MIPGKKKGDQRLDVEEQLVTLQTQLDQAREGEKRAIADYQNMMRRQQQERVQFIRLANKELVSALLQPLDHLSLAAEQIKDQGLQMVIDQFWQKLNELGLEEIEVMGQPFNVETMEAVEAQTENLVKKEQQPVVTKVIKPGYRYQGEVIQHAQVVLGY